MSADRRLDASLARASSLQAHLCRRGDALDLPEEPKRLLSEMREHLISASDEGLLETPAHDIFNLLKLSASPIDKRPEYRGIYGGEKDLKRTGARRHFRRRDGAWFFFTITVRSRRGQSLQLIAYDFELCFPPTAPGAERLPRFVRFDLNQPGHNNESIGLRSHMHPGHDDLSAPAPLMSPLELLDLVVAGLPVPERPRKA